MANMRRNIQLPDWFPLASYSQKMTKDEWLNEIVVRAALDAAASNGASSSTAEEAFREMFVAKRTDARRNMAEAQRKEFWPVRAPTPFEVFFIAESFRRRTPQYTKADAWVKRIHEEGKRVIGEFISSGAHEKMAQIKPKPAKAGEVDLYMNTLGKQAAVVVDLDHDDETLKQAFEVWLAGTRGSMGERAPHPIGDKEIAKWQKYGLLPAFDLAFWSQATNTEFTDAFVARVLWPDDGEEFVDLTERFRKVTRPMVAHVFHWNFICRFWRQMELEKSLNELVARDKAKKAEVKRKTKPV